MFPQGRFSAINAVLTGALLMACPSLASAQRRGAGASSSVGGGGLSSYSRPDGVDEKDQLKDFHESIALQAIGPQVTEFQTLLKTIAAAQVTLQTLLQSLQNQNAAFDLAQHNALDLALENSRTQTKNFQLGFSPEQKSGLKEILKRIAKTDTDLEQEEKKARSNFERPKSGIESRIPRNSCADRKPR